MRSVRDITRALSIIEREAMDRAGVSSQLARGVTAPLAQELLQAWAPGVTLTTYPRALYFLIAKLAAEGRKQQGIADEILRSHRQSALGPSGSE
jgi:hypothetical protein